MSIVHVHTAVAAVAVGVAFMGVAFATPVPTYNGDPFPSSSEVIGVPRNLVVGQFGTFISSALTDLNLSHVALMGGNEFFTYTDTVNLIYSNPSSIQTFPNGQLEIEVLNRSSLFQTGAFTAQLLTATFSGPLFSGIIFGSLSSPGNGTVTYSSGGPSGLRVDTTFLGLPVQDSDSANGGPPFYPVPLNLTTSPISTTPLPAALPLFGCGLALVGWLARRRKATAAAVAA